MAKLKMLVRVAGIAVVGLCALALAQGVQPLPPKARMINVPPPGGPPPTEVPEPMTVPPCAYTGCTAEQLDAWYGVGPKGAASAPAEAPRKADVKR